MDPIYLRVLVLRCQTGDGEALGELIARYSAGVRGFLRRLGVAEVADVEQEVWLEVWRGAHRLNDAGAFVGWVYRIARDKALQQRRRRGNAAKTLDGDVAAREAAAFSEEEALAVRAALGELSVEQRGVLEKRFVEGKSYAEIAAETEMPLGTVRSRIHYAKAALKARLAGRFWKGHLI